MGMIGFVEAAVLTYVLVASIGLLEAAIIRGTNYNDDGKKFAKRVTFMSLTWPVTVPVEAVKSLSEDYQLRGNKWL